MTSSMAGPIYVPPCFNAIAFDTTFSTLTTKGVVHVTRTGVAGVGEGLQNMLQATMAK